MDDLLCKYSKAFQWILDEDGKKLQVDHICGYTSLVVLDHRLSCMTINLREGYIFTGRRNSIFIC